jgi:succinoglycan biosynthesis protein ExoO
MNTRPPPQLPTVTVLIAAYNAQEFLGRAIHSALSQSIPVLEVLIVDDASADGTVAAVEQLALKDRRVRLVKLNRNGGPSAARNAGLDAARGEWVAVLDADDAYLPRRLERMLGAVAGRDVDIVVDNFRYYNPKTDTTSAPALEERDEIAEISLAHFLVRARPFTGEADWGLLKPVFRRAFLEEQGLRYPGFSRHGEDFLLLVEAFLHGAKYALFGEAGYLYTDRNSGYSRTTVNYELMWQHTEALMADPRIASEPVLLGRMRERVAALKRLATQSAAEQELSRCRRQRDYVSIVRRSLSDGAFRVVLWKKLQRKLVRAT